MTAKDARGAVAYDGTAALKMTAPEAPTKKHRFLRRKPAGKVKKAEKIEKTETSERSGLSWLAKSGQWTVPGAILAIAAVAIVLILTLASYAQLVVVNDQVVELRDSLSQLQSEQTQLAAQYELAYDLQAIEQQMLASGEMIQVQDWQTYTLELAEPDTVEYYQGSDVFQQIASFFQNLVAAVQEYF